MAERVPAHPLRFLAGALALGPLFALGLQLELALIGSLQLSTPFVPTRLFEGFGLELLASNALCAGLASALVGWCLRRRILRSAPRELAVLALACALLGGPTFAVLAFGLGLWGSALPGSPGVGAGWGEWALTAVLGGALFGVVLGPLFLPVTWPVARLGLSLLRRLGGGARPLEARAEERPPDAGQGEPAGGRARDYGAARQ